MKLEDLLINQFEKDQGQKKDQARIAQIKKRIFSALPEIDNMTQKNNFAHAIFFAAVTLCIVLFIAFNVLQNKSDKHITKAAPPHPTKQLEQTELLSPQQKMPINKPTSAIALSGKTPNITLASGFTFYLPVSWSAKISDQTKEHFSGRFFIPGANDKTSYVEIESIISSKQVLNPFIQVTRTHKESINGRESTIIEGREKFQHSVRLIKQVAFTSQNKTLTLTLYKNPGETLDSQFDQLANSVIAVKTMGWEQRLFFIQTAFAAEAIAGIDKDKYRLIEVMSDPIREQISKDDTVYGDGYAKFYKFEAFKGQRLTTVAMEDRTTNPGSFIRSELYDEHGQQLYSKDTRIEYEAPYTGTYYLIVRTFNNQEGGYLLKIFDRNQTENLTYLKFADGSEVLLDPNKSIPDYGEAEAAIIMQFISPVEVGEGVLRFRAKPKEFEADPGEVSVPIYLYGRLGSYNSDIKGQQFWKLPEDDPGNILKIRITQLSPSKIFIRPEQEELFPKNYHYNLSLNLPFIDSSGQTTGAISYGGGRFFTENPPQ